MNKRTKKFIFLLALLFILATIIPPVVAEVTPKLSEKFYFLSGETSDVSPQPPNSGGAKISDRVQVSPSQLVTQARQLYQNKEYERAASLWEQAAKGFANRGDNLNQAMALSNLSLTYQRLSQWEDANNAIKDSLKILNNQPENSLLLAQILDIKGKLEWETGQAAKAIDSWQQAASIYQQLNDSVALSQNNLNQAQALQDLGLYPRACKKILASLTFENISTCEQLEQLTTKELNQELTKIAVKPSLDKTKALQNLGEILLVIGQPERSQQVLETSLNLAEKLKSPEAIAATSLSLGNTAQALAAGEAVRSKRRPYEQQAQKSYDRVIKSSTDVTVQQQAKLNRLDFLIQKEKWSEAAPLWQDIQAQLDNLPLNRNNVYLQINLAHKLIELLDQDNPQPPEDIQLPSVSQLDRILVNAAQNARNLGDKRTEAYALGNLGRLYELTGELATAETYTKRAIAIE